eukprot:7184131-Prymnesium_polylepis.1
MAGPRHPRSKTGGAQGGQAVGRVSAAAVPVHHGGVGGEQQVQPGERRGAAHDRGELHHTAERARLQRARVPRGADEARRDGALGGLLRLARVWRAGQVQVLGGHDTRRADHRCHVPRHAAARQGRLWRREPRLQEGHGLRVRDEKGQQADRQGEADAAGRAGGAPRTAAAALQLLRLAPLRLAGQGVARDGADALPGRRREAARTRARANPRANPGRSPPRPTAPPPTTFAHGHPPRPPALLAAHRRRRVRRAAAVLFAEESLRQPGGEGQALPRPLQRAAGRGRPLLRGVDRPRPRRDSRRRVRLPRPQAAERAPRRRGA